MIICGAYFHLMPKTLVFNLTLAPLIVPWGPEIRKARNRGRPLGSRCGEGARGDRRETAGKPLKSAASRETVSLVVNFINLVQVSRSDAALTVNTPIVITKITITKLLYYIKLFLECSELIYFCHKARFMRRHYAWLRRFTHSIVFSARYFTSFSTSFRFVYRLTMPSGSRPLYWNSCRFNAMSVR